MGEKNTYYSKFDDMILSAKSAIFCCSRLEHLAQQSSCHRPLRVKIKMSWLHHPTAVANRIREEEN
jgi:hypothetical protein